jgi:hypothetical protein
MLNNNANQPNISGTNNIGLDRESVPEASNHVILDTRLLRITNY